MCVCKRACMGWILFSQQQRLCKRRRTLLWETRVLVQVTVLPPCANLSKFPDLSGFLRFLVVLRFQVAGRWCVEPR